VPAVQADAVAVVVDEPAGDDVRRGQRRSVANFIVNLLAALVAYTYQEKKPSLNLHSDNLVALPSVVF
jgi:hypothetical protein